MGDVVTLVYRYDEKPKPERMKGADVVLIIQPEVNKSGPVLFKVAKARKSKGGQIINGAAAMKLLEEYA